MEEILDNLNYNEVLHTTARGTRYLYLGRSKDDGVKYSINQNSKILPYATILSAFNAVENDDAEINAKWYRNYNSREYKSRPCNISVLKKLISRLE